MTTILPPQREATHSQPLNVQPAQSQAMDSKEAVLDAAQRLINQYGYAGFSMRDLAQQSGLAKATLYHHFQDKREIFLQVLQRDLAIVSERLAVAAAMPGDLHTRLGNVAAAFFELTTERGMVLLTTLRQAVGMESDFCNLMRDYRDELQRPIVQLLNDAIADGTIRPIDTDLATMSFFGILQVFTSRHLLMNDFELNEEAVDFVLDFVLRGLLSAPMGENEYPKNFKKTLISNCSKS
jgi:AcrR family transcriptional regulator